MKNPFISIDKALMVLKSGKMIVLMDDENRENEGDLVVAAEFVTPEIINFMSKFGRGLICMPMDRSLVNKFKLPMMVNNNKSPYGTAFTVSIEAAHGVSTGISAYDRAHTIKVAVSALSKSDDIISPGHVFPLLAKENGVLDRAGQTEASIDLVKLAGLRPASVICEIINENGTMSRLNDLILFSKKYDINLVNIRDLIDYRIKNEKLISEIETIRLPLKNYGEFFMTVYSNVIDNNEHFILTKLSELHDEIPLVRIHSECITGDVFGSCKCDCGMQLHKALYEINCKGGILIYLRQEGRGIGLSNKLKAYALQEKGYDTVEANLKLGLPADNRDYSVAFQILKYLNFNKIRLLTNNPEKVIALEKYGINIVERLPLVINATDDNRIYLKTKQKKLGHLLRIK
ncbi:3,4-dihydroxy-2-butanone-4-phosphate synthase [Candidatus Legionella polyplacis]|uniref:Riboflavin biosynthesis protein RibBA n=1 Tax=Candidatus Legionella polyplacis TaxID=2005262 RepID=A0ABZ2H195_9GAMM